MAEPLKNQFGPEIPQIIAGMLQAVDSSFPAKRFVKAALAGYDALELMPRGVQISRMLRKFLPADYAEALAMLVASTRQPHAHLARHGMTAFLFMPHMFFIRDYGLGHFLPSMQAQYELTQRFTAEFSIRPFIERYPEESLALLHRWAHDANPHVRRLVSEGTRPRLPWAPRLKEFQRDPVPVLQLLELLKDDSELYVRRSVANNLNDIGKDHPDLLHATAKRWLKGASAERRWIVQHALRSSIKRGEAGALAVMGVGSAADVSVEAVTLSSKRLRIGAAVTIAFALRSRSKRKQKILVDLQVNFVKANGQARPKVFKLQTVELGSGAIANFSKKISLAPMTTRQHYPGTHEVSALVNGRPIPLATFELLAAQ